jgi:hypothetical protein
MSANYLLEVMLLLWWGEGGVRFRDKVSLQLRLFGTIKGFVEIKKRIASGDI